MNSFDNLPVVQFLCKFVQLSAESLGQKQLKLNSLFGLYPDRVSILLWIL